VAVLDRTRTQQRKFKRFTDPELEAVLGQDRGHDVGEEKATPDDAPGEVTGEGAGQSAPSDPAPDDDAPVAPPD
jgi:proteasome alpha subunit